MPFEANNTMIYIRNITIRTAKSAPYLGNVGSSQRIRARGAVDQTFPNAACNTFDKAADPIRNATDYVTNTACYAANCITDAFCYRAYRISNTFSD